MRKLKITMLVCTAIVLLSGGYPAVADGDPGGPRRQVSQAQYDTLIEQCRYAGTGDKRRACEAEVDASYRVGSADPGLDCRHYAGVTVCGVLDLTPSERACVADSMANGIGRRRAEVECYVHF